jgi:hypothetical protein
MNAKEYSDQFPFDGDVQSGFVIMSETDLVQVMEEYANHYHQAQVKKLNIDDVSVSDSEIDNYATNQAQEYSDFEGEQIEIAENLSEGAKWVRDKIKTH